MINIPWGAFKPVEVATTLSTPYAQVPAIPAKTVIILEVILILRMTQLPVSEIYKKLNVESNVNPSKLLLSKALVANPPSPDEPINIKEDGLILYIKITNQFITIIK